MQAGKVVLDDGVAAKAALKSRGLILGHRSSEHLYVLDLVSFAPDSDEELFCEQVERMLVGGVTVAGVCCRDAGDNGRQLLWKCLAKRRGARTGVALVSMVLGASALKMFAFEEGDKWAARESSVLFATAKVLPRMTLHSVRLAIRVGVNVAKDCPPGTALERGAKLLRERIHSNVLVGPLAKDKTELFTLLPGPLCACEESGGATNLAVSGVISAFAYVHADCSQAEGAAVMLDDLAASFETRVSVMLDELDAMQEEGDSPAVEHALSRLKPALRLEGLRWGMPCRTLIRGGSVPMADWTFAWDKRGTETIARCLQVLGMTVEQADLDGSREPVEDSAFLELSGRQKQTHKNPPVIDAKVTSQSATKSSTLPLLVIGALLVAALATLVWRTTM